MAGKNVSDFQAHLVPDARFVSEGSVTAKLNFSTPARYALMAESERWRVVNEKIITPFDVEIGSRATSINFNGR